MKSGAPIRALVIGGWALLLSGCAERFITMANDTMLVVVDSVSGNDPLKSAKVHFTFAKPQALDETGSEKVVAMMYEAVFDCGNQSWGRSAQHLTTASGQTVSQAYPTASLEPAAPDSVGAAVVAAVCQSEAPTSRRPLRAIQKDYLKHAAP